MRPQIPDGDPAKIFDRALTALLHDLAKKKLAATDRPRENGSNVPGCTEQGFLEFHHVAPHAAGGESSAENIQLLCRAHNGHETELYFGPRNPLVAREARASYVHPPKQPRPQSRLGIHGNSVRTGYGLVEYPTLKDGGRTRRTHKARACEVTKVMFSRSRA